MPYNKNLAIAHGIAQGFEKTATNLYNIGQAREKLKREDEAFKLDKKVKEAQIKKLEFEYGPENLALERDKLKAEVAAEKSAYNLNVIKINAAEADEKRKAEQFKTGKLMLDKFMEGEAGSMPEGVSYDFGDLKIAGKADPMEKSYRDYVNKHLQAQAYIGPSRRSAPMSLEDYKNLQTGKGGTIPEDKGAAPGENLGTGNWWDE